MGPRSSKGWIFIPDNQQHLLLNTIFLYFTPSFPHRFIRDINKNCFLLLIYYKSIKKYWKHLININNKIV